MTMPPDAVTADVIIAATSAALGAVLGAGAAEVFAALNRGRERRERRSALAFGISDKTARMYSGCLTVVRRHLRGAAECRAALDEAALRPVEPGVQRPQNVSLFVRARANTAARYDFTTDDLWALAQIGGPPLLNAFNGLDTRHNSFQNAVDSYAAQHQIVMAEFPVHDVNGVLATAVLEPGPAANRLFAGLNALDEMIEDINRMGNSIAADSVTALRMLARAASRPLGGDYAIELQTVDGTVFSVTAREITEPRPPFPPLMTPR